ncbi:MAG: short-chain dehydrogenase [Sphingobacteriales bacterium]|nr:short-chain dehydrogenase [Sphingobacteriales bacterium]
MRNKQNYSLANKTIVITGASSGAGKAAALNFAVQNANLVLAARSSEALSEIVEECEDLGASAIAITTDVTDIAEVKYLAAKTIEAYGRIDIWINNAGVLAAGEFDKTPIQIHDKVIQTNLLGYMYGAHAVLPYFKKQGSGTIINNISVGGWLPTPYASSYTASKFGLLGFSEALRGELISWNQIHICDIFSGFLDTPGIQHAANYTGKVIKPALPVYNPQRIANAMVKLALNPHNRTTTDLAAPFLKLSYSLFPALTRYFTNLAIEKYLQQADAIPSTTGNLFAPVKYGTSVLGGWNYHYRQKFAPIGKAAVVLATIGFGLILLSKGK